MSHLFFQIISINESFFLMISALSSKNFNFHSDYSYIFHLYRVIQSFAKDLFTLTSSVRSVVSICFPLLCYLAHSLKFYQERSNQLILFTYICSTSML